MEFVAKDTGGDWYFDGNRTYRCLDADKKPIRKIYKEYLPDPVKLWDERCAKLEVTRDSVQGKQLRPVETTFKLWEHAHA